MIQKNYGNYMDDCIHLHACRLMSKKMRDAGYQGARYVARNCNEECVCYQRAQKVDAVTPYNAAAYAADGVSMIRGGWDTYDVYSSWEAYDQYGFTAYIIENGDACSDEINCYE